MGLGGTEGLNSVAAPDQLTHALKKIESGTLPRAEEKSVLDILEQYECWEPFITYLHAQISQSSNATVENYIRLARVQALFLEEAFGAAESCAALVKKLGISFATFQTDVLPRILEPDDFASEGLFLQSCYEHFADVADKVAAVERICFIYEKKTFNERLLGKFYTLLRQLDPKNHRALRYFRAVYTQSHDWDKALQVLGAMLEAAKFEQEVIRIALEMAAILLYQMDQPKEAIRYIDAYCSNSPLDTSVVHYDAYARLEDHKGCISVLRQCLLGVDELSERAAIHYRIGQLHELLHEPDLARENYLKAIQLNGNLLDAYESLIVLLINQKDWTEVQKQLLLFQNAIKEDALKDQIEVGLERLKLGLRHADNKQPTNS